MISRRKLFQNLGGSALLYPLMGALNETQVFAQGAMQKRALFLYYPNGNIANAFFPNSAGQFGSISSPLQEFRDEMSIIKGIYYQTTGSHEGGAQFCLTGSNVANDRYSIDNYLGDQLGANSLTKTLRLGVGTNFQNGADKAISYLQSSVAAVIEDHPRKAFYSIFGANMNPVELEQVKSADKSILDFSLDRLNKLNQSLGSIEKEKLDNHLTALRELEQRIDNKGQLTCENPVFNSRGVNFPENETSYPPTHQLNALYGRVSDMMTDIMVEAMHCGVTNVGLLQWSHAVSPTRFDFTGGPNISRGHHDMSHYGGDENGEIALEFKQSQQWHMNEMAKLFTKLKGRQVGDQSLWNSMAILASTEIGDSNLHDFKDICCFVAGNAGGALKQGQYFNRRTSYNQLLTTVVNAMGIAKDSYGDPSLGTGSIRELLT